MADFTVVGYGKDEVVCLRADLNTQVGNVKLGGVIGCEVMGWCV